MSPRDPSVRSGRQLPSKTLGRKRRLTFTYAPRLLEAIPVGVSRAFKGQALWVSNLCLRFTSLCPVTGQPDWGDLHLNYVPGASLVESKSLKEYLHSFRMHGDFHEDVCRVIVDDLARLLAPRYLELAGHFDSRGSIAIWPYVQYARPGDAEAAEILRHRRMNYRPGAYAPSELGRNI
jgi:7-cyano-7-deazaguanine reductase